MKINFNLSIKLLVLMFITAYSLTGHAAKIKCWTNKEGVRECGTTVPPEYAQQGHEEINAQGRTVSETARAKTKEEIAEEKRLADLEEEKKKAAEEQARKDRILLDTYTEVADIEKMRDENIKVIESRITLTIQQIDKTQADLDKRINAAAAAERSGKKPNDQLLKDIEELRKRIENSKNFIQEREDEIAGIRASYNADIARFKELHNM